MRHMPPHGNYKWQESKIGKAGLFQEAHTLIKQALSSSEWQATDKQALADMLEACLPQVVAPWGKDERKLLKLSALREAGK